MTLSADQRWALEIIANTGPRGATEGILLAHGFTDETSAGLVLARYSGDRDREGGRPDDQGRARAHH